MGDKQQTVQRFDAVDSGSADQLESAEQLSSRSAVPLFRSLRPRIVVV